MRLDKIKAVSLSALLLGSSGCCTINLHPSNDEYTTNERKPANILQGIGYTIENTIDEITLDGYEDDSQAYPFRESKVREPIDHRFFIFKYRFPWQEDAFKVLQFRKKP